MSCSSCGGSLRVSCSPSTSVGAGLSLATADPVLADLDDETLRRELLRCAQALLPNAARRRR
ncbi:MAG: hypothetical protein ACJ71T_02465 [Actinomycetales bacterium]